MFDPRRSLVALVCVFCFAACVPAVAGAAEPGAIEGTVTEVGTAAPIEGLEVQTYGINGTEGSGAALTDSSGNYEIDGLPEGEYEVEFTGQVCDSSDCSPKFAQRFYDEIKPFNTPTPVLVEAELTTPEIDAELELNGAIAGTVTDSHEAPIPDAFVCVNSMTEFYNDCAFSDANGEYEIHNLPPGEFNVQFTGRVCTDAGGCERESCESGASCPRTYIAGYYDEKLTEEEADLVTVVADQTVGGIDETLVQGGQITGRVTVAALGDPPLAGFTVCATPQATPANGECATTNAAGEYTIEGLATNEWAVEFGEACPESGCLGTYESQFFEGKAEEGEADPISLTAPEVKTGIDASIKELLPQVPSFTSRPEATGIPIVGRTLTCSEGTWAGNPTSLRFAWLLNGIPIAGAEADTYTPTSEDAGNDVTCEVTIENSAGSIEALSNNVLIHAEEAPVLTAQPMLSGTAAVGSTLTCTEGTAENFPTSTTFAWLRDGAAIAGQAGPTYNVTAEDQGALITCRVTMSNGAGSASSASNGVTIPPRQEETKPDQPIDTGGSSSSGGSSTAPATTTAPPRETTPPPGTASAASKATAGRSIAVKLTCSAKGDCKVTLKLTAEQKTKNAKGKTVVKWVAIGSGSVTVGAGKAATVAVPLNSTGEKLLKRAGRQGLKVKLSGSGVKPRTLTVH
ncbi:MAG TPA: carboxypeptidase regulatory-like domain-containing protein [Solirubrobacterales bacterium]|jgi:hypothetical protein|nr:carboxypeptidase regulatory-like domain-containing protein [Solirubrobacterales bacterium]